MIALKTVYRTWVQASAELTVQSYASFRRRNRDYRLRGIRTFVCSPWMGGLSSPIRVRGRTEVRKSNVFMAAIRLAYVR